jgi:hypothetical protein
MRRLATEVGGGGPHIQLRKRVVSDVLAET